jgi:hypothetical protein
LVDDNLPPVVQRDPYEFSALEGDIISSDITAYDPEGSRLTYTVNSTRASVQPGGKFRYKTTVSPLGGNEHFEYFRISVVDECNLQSSIIVKVHEFKFHDDNEYVNNNTIKRTMV